MERRMRAATFDRMTAFDPRAYWEQRLERSTGLEGVGFVGLGQSFNAWMYRVRRRVFLRTVREHMTDPRQATVLDVGSGTGVYLRCWQELGVARATGTDITATAVERLKKDMPGTDIFRMDITAGDPRCDGAFDAVSCMDVLFHILDDDLLQQALINLRKALRPGGVLFISENFLHQLPRTDRHFTERTLVFYTKALDDAGLRIVTRKPMFHLLNQPMDSKSAAMRWWWRTVERTAGTSYMLAGLLAAIVFPLELLLVRFRREGVSTEIMVCKVKG